MVMYVVEPPDREPFIPGDGTTSDGTNAAGAASNISLIPSSGGLAGYELGLMICCYNPATKVFFLGKFDATDYNCEDECVYYFKAEDVLEGREITISRVRIIYRDLGICKLSAVIETAQIISAPVEISIGSAGKTGKLVTGYFDLVITGERPQLKLIRAANAGPLNIVSATLITDVEVAEEV